MRRNVRGSSLEEQDGTIRRRLFASSPSRKPTRASRPYHTRDGLRIFIVMAAVVLVSIHLYLFEHVFVPTPSQPGAETNHHPEMPPHVSTPHLRSPTTITVSAPIPQVPLTPLREIDYQKYTIRINTWQRNEQLLVSVDHHAHCPGVHQVQVVWCDSEHEPPAELYDYPNVVVERHVENSLNERFRILTETQTLGILSMDDDVLRPCEALDAGFFLWTKSPHRMMGFDARTHVENDDGRWQYGYMSTTEKSNKYSMSLTRFCFIHKDYMDGYMNYLPKEIRSTVAKEFNCEDIAMSFFISSQTHGQPSLLADLWAIKSMLKLYVEKKISGNKGHKQIRDQCVDRFAQLLGLKQETGSRRLKLGKYVHSGKNWLLAAGDPPDETLQERHSPPMSQRQTLVEKIVQSWHNKGGAVIQKELRMLMSKAGKRAYVQGLLEDTDPWKKRFGK